MSSIPAKVLEEASTIASHLTRGKSVDTTSQSDEPHTTADIYTTGQQLVQVARNSLLDAHALRYVHGLKE